MRPKTLNDYRHKYEVKPSGCWEWMGCLNRGGYGTITTGSRIDGSRRSTLAHRIMYQIANNEQELEKCVLHRCDNPKCVNPDHLFSGTRADNHADMLKKGRRVDLRGEERPNSKLTEKKVKFIRTMLKNGDKQKDIAEIWGVNQTLISAIKTGKVWDHV